MDAPDQAESGDARNSHARVREGGVFQSRRLGEGSNRVADHRTGGEGREAQAGGTIVEGTSGNTGVGLAIAAALRGYKCIFTMPDKMSQEKVRLLKAFGAEVIVTPTAVPPDHPDNYVVMAKRIAKETPNAILADQFYNEANPEAHYATTGPELWEQTEGKITHFVASAGTGGTTHWCRALPEGAQQEDQDHCR